MQPTRRTFLAAAASLPAAPVIPPQPGSGPSLVRITGVDLFDIDIPVTKAEADAGVQNRFSVAKVMAETGVAGYSFAVPPSRALGEV